MCAMFALKPIGYIQTPFQFKNGTPRQPTVCSQARGTITIDKAVFNNPEHSLEGLEQYSHVWIFFIFHKNNNAHYKAKVAPPRLNGRRVGVFSTRSPYRPNNVGLTLAKIEQVKGSSVVVSGVDILDGTPVVDLKPYIPQYDCPDFRSQGADPQAGLVGTEVGGSACNVAGEDDISHVNNSDELLGNVPRKNASEKKSECSNELDTSTQCENSAIENSVHVVSPTDMADRALGESEQPTPTKDVKGNKRVETVDIDSEILKKRPHKNVVSKPGTVSANSVSSASWVTEAPVSKLTVWFIERAERQLQQFARTPRADSPDPFTLQHLGSPEEARTAIVNILQEDPRSTYRRKHCADSLYYFTVDALHLTCWFFDDCVEVLRVQPVAAVDKLRDKLT
ncbi:tRNA (adenine(37)-N6)-methyltransferase-like [Mya arenaria]|nr:tRNA (adenine(37)-N6)-methyltransferase-like [Mya arenaria]XP_052797080.1 tRNA (adenine(37)-N6)-methyltransferase-like [Mya arenaria]